MVVLTPTRDESQLPLGDAGLGTNALELLLDVLAGADDENTFRAKVAPLQQRALSKLSDLFEEVLTAPSAVTFTLATDGEIRRAIVSSHAAKAALEIIATNSEDAVDLPPVRATLIGANLRTRSFEIRPAVALDNRDSIGGKMDSEMAERVDRLEVGSEHLVSLRRETSLDSITGEPKVKYRLISILPLNDSLDL